MPRATPGRQEPRFDVNAQPLTGIRRLTALDTVRARIALAVRLGLLTPGERLPPTGEIADALEVGEITVRRALVSLSEDGVLERRRGRSGGTLVAARPSRGAVRAIAAYRAASTDVHRLIDHRLMLECGIAHLAARQASAAQTRRLAKLVDQMAHARAWTDFHALDARFHGAVAEAAGNPAAAEVYGGVLHELYRYFLPYPMEYLRRSNGEHRDLVAALTDRDPIAAVDAARHHVEVLHTTMFVGLADPPPEEQG